MRNGVLLILLGFFGCSEEPIQPIPDPLPIRPIRVISEIVPGERPEAIDSARFMSVSEFLHPSVGPMSWNVGDWVCLEGNIQRSGDRFGAIYVHLSPPESMEYVEFEAGGDILAGATPGKNVLLRGQISSHNNHLSNVSFVTQEQIDLALKSMKGMP